MTILSIACAIGWLFSGLYALELRGRLRIALENVKFWEESSERSNAHWRSKCTDVVIAEQKLNEIRRILGARETPK